MTHSFHPTVLREYDIRGVIGKTLNAADYGAVGAAFGTIVKRKGGRQVVVGYDGRLSSVELEAALVQGLASTGIEVVRVGLGPTPMLYFAQKHLDADAGVMVTGSHNPPDYNGIKMVLRSGPVYGDQILEIGRLATAGDLETGDGRVSDLDLRDLYVERLLRDYDGTRDLTVVWDNGNGAAGEVLRRLTAKLPGKHILLFDDIDGRFPNHHPDPTIPDNLVALQAKVAEARADLGIAFDGDGDRLGIVTPAGEVIFPDRTLMLFARDVLSRNKGATIIYDVKCTGKLAPVIEKAGGVPLMWRTGHSLIKGKMRETGAALAGEMSGHFFFKERWYGFDDGLYAGARLLEILSGDAQQRAPQAIFEELPNSVSTPELKIELAEGEHYKFIERFQKEAKFEGARINTIDGVRADWPDGWGLVRASNTTPVLVLRFDAESMEALKRVQNLFRAQLLAINPKLKLPF